MKSIFGLIGFPLSHSFSKEYFKNKFLTEGIENAVYENFELDDIDKINELIISQPNLTGLNVTIPYKESIIKYLATLDPDARRVGAVNVVKKLSNGDLKGFNSDYYGFRLTLEKWMGQDLRTSRAVLMGTGGAAKAVMAVLEDCNIDYIKVSRTTGKDRITYYDLREKPSLLRNYNLVINTTPLGMYPNINEMPNLPYDSLREDMYLYDLIYNPEKTLFLQKGESMGCKIMNGRDMLVLQAERSWEIWNSKE